MTLLEVCTSTPAGIDEAIAGGAGRIELCSALAEGGLTPSIGLISLAARKPVKVNVLIRPREGDFVYTDEEIAVMEADIREAVKAGADGIVTGALTPEGDIAAEACRRLIDAAGDADTTFHRAFDVCRDPFEALETVISLGFKRILTSGQAPTAPAGAETIRELHRAAAGRIKIMAGSGVSPANAALLLELSGADEIHASARALKPSAMRLADKGVKMGNADASDGSRLDTDSQTVRAIRAAIENA